MSLYDLYYLNCAYNYAQNGVQESLREVRSEPQLIHLSLYAALTKKRNIFECSAVAWCAVRLYTPHTFLVMHEEKKKKKKKDRRREKEEQQHNLNFAFGFLSCAEKWQNSVAIFYIKIAKGFHP